MITKNKTIEYLKNNIEDFITMIEENELMDEEFENIRELSEQIHEELLGL